MVTKLKIILIFIVFLFLGFWLLQLHKVPTTQIALPNILNFSVHKISTPLTLEKVFDKEVEEGTTLFATGDIMLGRSVNMQATKRNNFAWSFERVADVLQKNDLTLVNLEGPLIENCPLTDTGMIFCANKKHITGLTLAGVDIANLANNHILNYGQRGLTQTQDILKNVGVSHIGFDQPVYKTINNLDFAFLGYNDVDSKKLEKEEIKQDIKEVRQYANFVIVSFHWGKEYEFLPSARQRELGHLAIDSGAQLVIGHHPHWIQPLEVYKNKVIAYSLGNFIFDQMWSQETKEGLAIRCIFDKTGIVDVELIPVIIENYGQVRLAQDLEKEKIITKMRTAPLN